MSDTTRLWGVFAAQVFGAVSAATLVTDAPWVSVGMLVTFVVLAALAGAFETRALWLAREALAEAQAAEGLVRRAAEQALGTCTIVRPERTLTGDVVLHVIPPASGVDLQPGVELWHVHIGREDIARVGRS